MRAFCLQVHMRSCRLARLRPKTWWIVHIKLGCWSNPGLYVGLFKICAQSLTQAQVNSLDIAADLLRFGVDGIITDYPNVVRRWVQQQGLEVAPKYPKRRVLSCLKRHNI